MRVVRRYLMRVDPFTPKVPVHELFVEVLPDTDGARVRVIEMRDSGWNQPFVDLREHVVHIEYVEHHLLAWGLADLSFALYDEQLRGRAEWRSAHQIFLAIATDTTEPNGFARPWAREWLPEWAAWWDEAMRGSRAERGP